MRWTRGRHRRGLEHQVHRALLAVVVCSALCAALVARVVHSGADQVPGPIAGGLRLLVEDLPPDPDATRERLERARRSLGVDLCLFGADGQPLASAGAPLPLPRDSGPEAAWFYARPGWGVRVRLDDGRTIAAAARSAGDPDRFLRHLGVLLAVLAVLAALARPIAKRLTGRLHTLGETVRRWGSGELGARAVIDGEDELSDLARNFNDSADRIARLVDTERRLLASASHELRSPLARIRMTLELLPESESRPEVRAAITDVEELDQLVGDLLLAGRSRAGPAPANLPEVDLAALVEDECARSGASHRCEAVRIRGDASMLRRLLRNLVDNAQHHGGGLVEVELDAEGPVLRVLDRGPGVPESERERVFEAFHRPPGHDEGRDGGVGLGLALVRDLAAWHGATVRCGDREGGGATFEVRWPGAG